MKSFTAILSVLILVLISNLVPAQDTLTILHLNDTHSMLAPMAPRTEDLKGTVGGIARAATVIGMTKMTDPNVLTLHAGDAFVGDFFFNAFAGIAEFRLLNAIGLDVMTIGNHEFDLGPAVLKMTLDSSLAAGGFSVVSSNLILEDPQVAPLKNYIKPYTVKQIGKLKAGIFGLVTPAANILSSPAPAVVDTDIASSVTKALTALAKEGCDIIICLSHLGINNDKTIAGLIPGIDVIISAHDHIMTNSPVEVPNPSGKKTFIVQANSCYSHIGKLSLVISSGNITKAAYKLIALDSTIPEVAVISAAVDGLIKDIEAQFGPVFSQKIGTSEGYFSEIAESLSVSGSHDTHIGNLITDAFRWKTGTQIAFEAGGSTCMPIFKGPILPVDILRVVPYGSKLAKFRMKGIDLWKGLEAGVSQIEADDELLPQVSGLRYSYDISKDPFSRIQRVTINGIDIDTAAYYTVTSTDFMINILSSMFGVQVTDLYIYNDSTEYDVLKDYIIFKKVISPQAESRLTPVNEPDRVLPSGFFLMQNYPNPFNPATSIEFSLPEKEYVTLTIYNSCGEKVCDLVNGWLSAGPHRSVWNAAGLSSGMYIYQLRAGANMASRKMLLIK